MKSSFTNLVAQSLFSLEIGIPFGNKNPYGPLQWFSDIISQPNGIRSAETPFLCSGYSVFF